ncbi:TetR/AcrR family transcriptional regulator [Thalassotalea euphylliae]|uniref:TetR/AcrR family transcriptional regulator n=1 Tax=Thalassotalea euphylliae TaxID=1655234 RepID=A0A3E0TR00_9GAMM|nr:TetR/AcrR family transcriptional regulator [Thalassotalea euphylliae]REL26979.1 TetR/AcrR family transcriptional regulator [Thalassotalea euphylliae]
MNEKRQHLLETALQLFYHYGVQAVGINEILKTSGIAKKTLYHHFPSKDELVIAALSMRDERYCAWFEGLLVGSASNDELAERIFNGLSQWFNDEVGSLDKFRGCFFINTSAEYSDASCPISIRCKEHKQRIKAIIARHLVEPDETYLEFLCTLKEGAIVLAYVCQDKQAAEKAYATVRKFISK